MPCVVTSLCALEVSREGCVGPSVVQADRVGSLVGSTGIYSSWLSAHALWRGCWSYWLVGPSHQAADCGTPGGLGLEPVHWWVGAVRVQKLWGCCPSTTGEWNQILVLMLDHLWSESGPGVWLQCPGITGLVCWGVVREVFPDPVSYGVKGILRLCWPASREGQGQLVPG